METISINASSYRRNRVLCMLVHLLNVRTYDSVYPIEFYSRSLRVIDYFHVCYQVVGDVLSRVDIQSGFHYTRIFLLIFWELSVNYSIQKETLYYATSEVILDFIFELLVREHPSHFIRDGQFLRVVQTFDVLSRAQVLR
jgi:hypothetical protein